VYRGIVGGVGTGTGVAGAGLAVTGSPAATWTMLAVALLVTGAFLTRMARRRHAGR
jgi:hypothetical protein